MAYVIGTLSRFSDLVVRFCESVRLTGETAEILIADDGLPADLDLSGFAPVRRLSCPRPFIFSRNANMIFAAAGAADVFLANDDTLLSCAIHPLAEIAAGEGVGIVSAAIEGQVGNLEQQHRDGGGVRDLGESTVCFVAVYLSRRLIEAVGPMDERFTGYGFEDDDYSLRARRAGFRNVVDDRVIVSHPHANSSFRRTGRANGYAFMQGRAIFAAKWGPR